MDHRPSARDIHGLVVIDKPAGWTSHDVVARLRFLLSTRKIGHAGTLDPMATGVLVLGVGQATRLLTYLTHSDKTYSATIVLGAETVTDDSEGELGQCPGVSGISSHDIAEAVSGFRGQIKQVPAAVSAIKVSGKRAYQRVRDGEQVDLAARVVTIGEYTIVAIRLVQAQWGDAYEVDVTVSCSAGTYIRSLARDLGLALGTRGHLSALRRLSVGPFSLADAVSLSDIERDGQSLCLPLSQAVRRYIPHRYVDAQRARIVSHGGRLAGIGIAGIHGIFSPNGDVVALSEEIEGVAKVQVGFPS